MAKAITEPQTSPQLLNVTSDRDHLARMLERAEIPFHEYNLGSSHSFIVDTGTSYNPSFTFSPQGQLLRLRVS